MTSVQLRKSIVFCFILMVVLAPGRVRAQVSGATLSGTITDVSGARIPALKCRFRMLPRASLEPSQRMQPASTPYLTCCLMPIRSSSLRMDSRLRRILVSL